MKEELDKYFLAIIPPSPFFEEAFHFKEEAFALYNTKGALRSPPHVTLHMPFGVKEKNSTWLKSELMEFARSRKPFPISIENWGSFPPRVVFLNVLNTLELSALQKDLGFFMRAEFNILNADFKEKPFHPHVTIAFRDLRKAVFEETFRYFSTKSVNWTWTVNSIFLLKHDGKKWNIEAEHPFQK